MPSIVLGTRGSLLARTQTGHVAEALRLAGHEVTIEIISTAGDVNREAPVASLGSDGVFVRELERALLDRRIDAAVHSCKDLPTAETHGLRLAAVPRRACPFDVLVARNGHRLEQLPPGAVVGTSSIRRVAQLLRLRPDLTTVPVRGNIDTRLNQVDTGAYAAVILAAAGLERVGLMARATDVLAPPRFWPAIAQGALAVQIREDDHALAESLRAIDDEASHRAVLAERACLAALAGGCLAPIGGYASENDGVLELSACVLETIPGGVRRIEAVATLEIDSSSIFQAGGASELRQVSTVEPGTAAESLGRRVAGLLREAGADEMLDRVREQPFGSASL
jgi:hydroxymethylbilane synthase